MATIGVRFLNGRRQTMLVNSRSAVLLVSTGVAKSLWIPVQQLRLEKLNTFSAAGGLPLKIVSFYEGPLFVCEKDIQQRVWVIVEFPEALIGKDFDSKTGVKVDFVDNLVTTTINRPEMEDFLPATSFGQIKAQLPEYF